MLMQSFARFKPRSQSKVLPKQYKPRQRVNHPNASFIAIEICRRRGMPRVWADFGNERADFAVPYAKEPTASVDEPPATYA